MKTILHVIDTTGPGGAETVFVELAASFQDQGVRSIALIRGSGWVMDELKKRNVEVIELECKGSFNLRFLLSLISLIRARKVALIHSHLLGSNVYSSLAGLLTATPVISTFHGSVDVQGKERFVAAKFWSINLGSKAVVAVTRKLSEDLLSRTPVSPGKIHVIYNGIDTQKFSAPKNTALRETLGLSEKTLLIGALGNIRPAKDYMVAVKALDLMVERGIDVHLAIAGQGTGPLKDEIDEYCRSKKLQNRVHLLGFVSDAPAFLAGIDIFMLSSKSEGHPLAITQAMAMGLPIVATICGVEEILTHNQNACLVEKENPRALADAMLEMANDDARRERLARHAKKTAVDNYDLGVMKQKYLALYRSIAS